MHNIHWAGFELTLVFSMSTSSGAEIGTTLAKHLSVCHTIRLTSNTILRETKDFSN